MSTDPVLGGFAKAWRHGALVKGRPVLAEEINIQSLSAKISALREETKLPIIFLVPLDDVSDLADGVLCMAGVEITRASTDDQSGPLVEIDFSGDAVLAVDGLHVPDTVWQTIEQESGLEVDGEEDIYLAAGGWSDVRLLLDGEEVYQVTSGDFAAVVRISADLTHGGRIKVTYA